MTDKTIDIKERAFISGQNSIVIPNELIGMTKAKRLSDEMVAMMSETLVVDSSTGDRFAFRLAYNSTEVVSVEGVLERRLYAKQVTVGELVGTIAHLHRQLVAEREAALQLREAINLLSAYHGPNELYRAVVECIKVNERIKLEAAKGDINGQG